MSLVDVRTTRVVFTLLLFALGLGFLYVAHHTLIAFLFAIFFAYLLDPAISRVEKWTRSRGLAIAAVYFLMISVLATFFFFVGPNIAHQAQRLSESLPTLLEKVGSGQIAEEIGQQHGWSQDTRNEMRSFLVGHRQSMVRLAQRAGIRIAEVAQDAWLLIRYWRHSSLRMAAPLAKCCCHSRMPGRNANSWKEFSAI
jgi:predicted PurR-regulated permease PerM